MGKAAAKRRVPTISFAEHCGGHGAQARAGATLSVPVAWDELGPNLAPDKFTVLNIARRLGTLKQGPWADIGKVKQKLPTLK